MKRKRVRTYVCNIFTVTKFTCVENFSFYKCYSSDQVTPKREEISEKEKFKILKTLNGSPTFQLPYCKNTK